MTDKIYQVDSEIKVDYCIPLWLRDQQIRVNTANVKGRIEPSYEIKEDPIAIVCYGPSLNDTWEKIKDFKYVMTCSGAHKFLLEKGVRITHHCEVDPRDHKIKLLGEPHKDIEYLIASTCHPKYFKHLEGFNIKLWHVFDPNEEPLRILPPGEWSLTGGCGCGVRAMTLSRFLGFKNQHIFGMDGSEGLTGKHAGEHPNQAKSHSICEYKGVSYKTTPAFLEAARQTWHELDQMPDVTATFYGEGLVQAMSKDYIRKPPTTGGQIAFVKPELISKDYRELNRKLHEENLAYGVGGSKHAPMVIKLSESLKTTSILDYGNGKGTLAAALPFPIWEYDPAIPGKEMTPKPAEIVVCTDVLEHIEPEKLQYVLLDLARCVKLIGFFTIHTGPSKKFLADGRNTHLIQKDEKWWKDQLKQYFKIGKIIKVGLELYVVVSPKEKNKKSPITMNAVTASEENKS